MSGFDPHAVSSAGVQVIAQLSSTSLALASYNAGPAPVAACNCVPPYPETRAYVARILALMGGGRDGAPARGSPRRIACARCPP